MSTVRQTIQQIARPCVRDVTHNGVSGGSFDYYVDSVNGDDSNDGSRATPFATLGAAISASEDAEKIGIARGSVLRESFFKESGVAQQIGSYGTGVLPKIYGSDVATGWTLATDQTNVYEVSWVHEATSSGRIVAFEDDLILVRVASIADCEATAGTFTTGDANGTATTSPTTVYIHPSDSGNPNSNGKTYEINKRNRVLKGYSNLVVKGVEIGRQIANNGSYDCDTSGVFENALCRDGHKHNALMGTGSAKNIVFFGCDEPTTSEPTNVPFVHYLIDINGVTGPTVRNCGYIHQDELMSAANAFYAHESGTDRYASIDYYDCFAKSGNSGIAGTFFVDNWKIERFFADGLGRVSGQGSGSTLEANYLIYINASGSIAINGFGRYKINDSIFEIPGTSTTEFIRLRANSIHEYNRTIFAMAGRAFMIEQSATNATLKINHCMFLGSSGFREYVDISNTGITYESDHVIYHRPGGQLKNKGTDGTVRFTLSDWQDHTGQDTNSVYLTNDQYDAFFVGDPYAGDTRISPTATATTADGTVVSAFPDGTPFTSCGPAQPQIAVPRIPTTLAEARDFIDNKNGTWFGKGQAVWGSH